MNFKARMTKNYTVKRCDFSTYEINLTISYDTFLLHRNPNHNFNANKNTGPNPNSAVVVNNPNDIMKGVR